MIYIHNKHDKERIGLAYCPCAHSLTPGSTTSEHYREKAGRTQPEDDRTQDIKTDNRHTNTRVSPRHTHPARRYTPLRENVRYIQWRENDNVVTIIPVATSVPGSCSHADLNGDGWTDWKKTWKTTRQSKRASGSITDIIWDDYFYYKL